VEMEEVMEMVVVMVV
jgi:hypothetical protein